MICGQREVISEPGGNPTLLYLTRMFINVSFTSQSSLTVMKLSESGSQDECRGGNKAVISDMIMIESDQIIIS